MGKFSGQLLVVREQRYDPVYFRLHAIRTRVEYPCPAAVHQREHGGVQQDGACGLCCWQILRGPEHCMLAARVSNCMHLSSLAIFSKLTLV